MLGCNSVTEYLPSIQEAPVQCPQPERKIKGKGRVKYLKISKTKILGSFDCSEVMYILNLSLSQRELPLAPGRLSSPSPHSSSSPGDVKGREGSVSREKGMPLLSALRLHASRWESALTHFRVNITNQAVLQESVSPSLTDWMLIPHLFSLPLSLPSAILQPRSKYLQCSVHLESQTKNTP